MPEMLSVVVPAYNEEAGLPSLFARLYPSLDQLDIAYELIIVDDGSRDRSAALLKAQVEKRPDVTRVVLLARNAGQHSAILAGFEVARGEWVITLDADLQNPPEEIPRIVDCLHQGNDFVSTVRTFRQDSWFRVFASRWMNRLRQAITPVRIRDQGSMLCGYSKELVEVINACAESTTYLPALASTLCTSQAEIEVSHAERELGESKYSLLALIRLNYNLLTGFSAAPLQIFSYLGVVISVGAVFIYAAVTAKRTLEGQFWLGVRELWDRDILQFFLIGVILFGQGILGEYIVRIYQEVRRRPRYRVREVVEKIDEN